MFIFDIFSVTVNVFIMSIVAMKARYLRTRMPIRIKKIGLWVITVMFVLNTAGNVFSKMLSEAIIFTPLTLLSTILCYRIAVEDSNALLHAE
jgi:uncharacterized membrane protein AbrB (regulator of aidB expression)